MPAKSPGLGWVRVTCQPFLPVFSRCSRSSGWYFAIAIATAVWIAPNPHDGRTGASRSSTKAAACSDRGWVAWATWRACHGLDLRGVSTSRQIRGSRCCRSRASAISRIPAAVEMPSVAASGFGGERGDRRGALAAQGLVHTQHAGQGGAAPGGDAGVRGRGVPDAPLGGEPELAPLAGADVELALFEHREELVVVEVLDDDRSSCCIGFEHVSIQAGATDSPTPENGPVSGLLGKSEGKEFRGSRGPASGAGVSRLSRGRLRTSTTGANPQAGRQPQAAAYLSL